LISGIKRIEAQRGAFRSPRPLPIDPQGKIAQVLSLGRSLEALRREYCRPQALHLFFPESKPNSCRN
jgi:hypothetical protein